jgi:hypothetical protein
LKIHKNIFIFFDGRNIKTNPFIWDLSLSLFHPYFFINSMTLFQIYRKKNERSNEAFKYVGIKITNQAIAQLVMTLHVKLEFIMRFIMATVVQYTLISFRKCDKLV